MARKKAHRLTLGSVNSNSGSWKVLGVPAAKHSRLSKRERQRYERELKRWKGEQKRRLSGFERWLREYVECPTCGITSERRVRLERLWVSNNEPSAPVPRKPKRKVRR